MDSPFNHHQSQRPGSPMMITQKQKEALADLPLTRSLTLPSFHFYSDILIKIEKG